MQVALRRHGQIELAVPGQVREHVIEEADAGGDFALARAVEIEAQVDLRFVGFAVDFRAVFVTYDGIQASCPEDGLGCSPVYENARQFSRLSISPSVPTEIRKPSP